LLFAHGLNIHFNLIEPRKDLDVAMVGPRAPATRCARISQGGGVPCSSLCIRTPRATPMSWAVLRSAIAAAAGIIETTFREECETDLFGEQVVLCGDWSNSSAPASRR